MCSDKPRSKFGKWLDRKDITHVKMAKLTVASRPTITRLSKTMVSSRI
ncbi:hypothetical protein ACSVDA_21265 [Cytobacillus sp. Hm23]